MNNVLSVEFIRLEVSRFHANTKIEEGKHKENKRRDILNDRGKKRSERHDRKKERHEHRESKKKFSALHRSQTVGIAEGIVGGKSRYKFTG